MTDNKILSAFAKALRVITVPPVMVAALLVILRFAREGMFTDTAQLLLSILFLAIIPVLAYPFTELFPLLRKNRRENERNLAFVFTVIGYVGGIVWAIATGAGKALVMVFTTYLLSALFLLLCNKVIKKRASGHACSIAGPILLLICLTGWRFVIPCVIIFAAVTWSSVYLGRHTPKELVYGTICAAAGFLIGLPVLYL